jgi:hypothetical protein
VPFQGWIPATTSASSPFVSSQAPITPIGSSGRVSGEFPADSASVHDDVAFLFSPEELHSAARTFFVDAEENHTGPAYLCAYLDPICDDKRLRAAFASCSL